MGVGLRPRLAFDTWRWQVQLLKDQRRLREEKEIWHRLLFQGWRNQVIALDYRKLQAQMRAARAVTRKSVGCQVDAREQDDALLWATFVLQVWRSEVAGTTLAETRDHLRNVRSTLSAAKGHVRRYWEKHLEARRAQDAELWVTLVLGTWREGVAAARAERALSKLRITRGSMRTSLEDQMNKRQSEDLEMLRRLLFEVWRGDVKTISAQKARIRARNMFTACNKIANCSDVQQACLSAVLVFELWELFVGSAKFQRLDLVERAEKQKVQHFEAQEAKWLSTAAHGHTLIRVEKGAYWRAWTCQGCESSSKDNPPIVYRCGQARDFNLCAHCYKKRTELEAPKPWQSGP